MRQAWIMCVVLMTTFGVEAQSPTEARRTAPQQKSSERRLERAPLIYGIGSNDIDGSVTVACEGNAPYTRVSCRIYKTWISQLSQTDFNRSRAELEKDLSALGDERFRALSESCSPARLANIESAVKEAHSPGRAAAAQDGYNNRKALCACKTKQCVATTMLEQQTHEQKECVIHNSVIAVDFVKVNQRKWVSTNNGPDGLCGVVSVFTMELEAGSDVLMTYTEHWEYTNNTEGLCKGLPKTDDYKYSWNSGSVVRPMCEEFKFETIPEPR